VQVDTTTKQVLPKRSSAIDFVGYVESVLGHAGEYPSCVIRESQPDPVERNPLAFPSAGFTADAFLGGGSHLDWSDLEDTVPLGVRPEPGSGGFPSLEPREPRLVLTPLEAEEILLGAEITAPRSSVHEIDVDDILEERCIDPGPPPPSSVRAVAIAAPLHAGFRPADLHAPAAAFPSAPSPRDLPVLERTYARRGRGPFVVGLALLLVASAGIAAVVSSGSAPAVTAWVSERAARVHDLVLPQEPTTTAVQTMEGQWTAPARATTPETPRARPPAAENKAPGIPVVAFESLPRAR